MTLMRCNTPTRRIEEGLTTSKHTVLRNPVIISLIAELTSKNLDLGSQIIYLTLKDFHFNQK